MCKIKTNKQTNTEQGMNSNPISYPRMFFLLPSSHSLILKEISVPLQQWIQRIRHCYVCYIITVKRKIIWCCVPLKSQPDKKSHLWTLKVSGLLLYFLIYFKHNWPYRKSTLDQSHTLSKARDRVSGKISKAGNKSSQHKNVHSEWEKDRLRGMHQTGPTTMGSTVAGEGY